MAKNRLKISVITNENINSNIEYILYKTIARQIFESENFQNFLNKHSKQEICLKETS
ncbi:MAG TPA: hypothetical protein PK566_00165 [Pseudobacteroides sp.]|nr:hypothetical protein [Pseudobacteroides sp.]